MSITKSELSETLVSDLRMSKRDSKDLVDLLFEQIRLSLVGGESVKVSGFGNFDLRDKSQRPGRNPKTGQDVEISARRVVTFKPGQKLKARVESPEGLCPDGADAHNS